MNDRKVRIASAGNTVNHAIEALKAKGYSVVIYPDASGSDSYDYWAIKDGREFVAEAIKVQMPGNPTRAELAALVSSFYSAG